MRRRLAWLLILPVLAGCRFHTSHHTVRGVHILGIGWLFESDRTNKSRAFAIGSLDAVRSDLTITTNAGPPAP